MNMTVFDKALLRWVQNSPAQAPCTFLVLTDGYEPVLQSLINDRYNLRPDRENDPFFGIDFQTGRQRAINGSERMCKLVALEQAYMPDVLVKHKADLEAVSRETMSTDTFVNRHLYTEAVQSSIHHINNAPADLGSFTTTDDEGDEIPVVITDPSWVLFLV